MLLNQLTPYLSKAAIENLPIYLENKQNFTGIQSSLHGYRLCCYLLIFSSLNSVMAKQNYPLDSEECHGHLLKV